MSLLLFLVIVSIVNLGNSVAGNKIVGGFDAKPNVAPYQASLLYGGKFFCGAVIVHQRFILTAGHCVQRVKPEDLTIAVGTNDLNNGSIFYQPDEIIAHSR